MGESEDIKITYSGRSIAKNTIYNLLGYGIPLVFAVVLIPFLIKGLGDERFGILNLAWIVIGYSGFFDMGIGRGLTKVISEKIGNNINENISDIFWTSFLIMFVISSLATIVFAFFMPYLVEIFHISANLYNETLMTFYGITLAIPVVSTTAGLRGVLEAYQKFKAINLIRSFLGICTFLAPLIVLFFTNSLFVIILVMFFIRVFVWILYLLQCFKVNSSIKSRVTFRLNSVRSVLKFSIWITIANIINPIIVYSDRFLIGIFASAVAITYYATPYQIVTKILLIPTSLIVVLFPLFSSSFQDNPGLTKKLLSRAIKMVFLVIYPVIFIIVTFSFDIINLWLGEKFANNCSLVLQLLAVGILMNSLSVVPNNFFQGIGKPKIPTLISLIELPFYIVAMLISIKNFGINGAALTYMIAATINNIVMYLIAYKIGAIKIKTNSVLILTVFIMVGLAIPFLLELFYLKLIFAVLFVSLFFFVIWSYLLSANEKIMILFRLKTVVNN